MTILVFRLGARQTPRGNFMKTFFRRTPESSRKICNCLARRHFLEKHLRVVSLVLDLEHSCFWPREGLSSQRRFLALALEFFCVLSLEPCVLDSTSDVGIYFSGMLQITVYKLGSRWTRTLKVGIAPCSLISVAVVRK